MMLISQPFRARFFKWFVAPTVAVAAAAFAFPFAGYDGIEKSENPDFQPVMQAVFVIDRLWLLHDDGLLVSLKIDQAIPEKAAINGRVSAICKSGSNLVAVVEGNRKRWTLKRHVAGQWNYIASVPMESDRLAALDCSNEEIGVTILTDKRLLDVSGSNVRQLNLKNKISSPLTNGIALTSGDVVWVGFNAGEWGGGLSHINRASGKVENVEYNKSGNLCGGPLNTACDPINGIVTSPAKPSCVIAAVGLVHMMAHGRIVEICSKSVRRLYFKPLDPQPPHNQLDDGEPSSTVAFFGLARAGDTIWAVGIDGLYRFDGTTAPQFQPLPKFENRGGYFVSFDVPEIVLVMTDVNQRTSLSGASPIILTR